MPLGSLVPVPSNNFLKNFPATHATNMDRIDDFAGPCLTTHPLQSFTPFFDGTSGTPVLGTGGSNIAYYYEIFDQIYMFGQIRWGSSGASFGGGYYTLTVPFTFRSNMGFGGDLLFAPIVGVGTTYDDSSNAGRLPLTVHARTSTQLMFGIRTNAGSANRELRSGGYTTWAINDGINWSARVQRIP